MGNMKTKEVIIEQQKDFIDTNKFLQFEEPRNFSVLESQIYNQKSDSEDDYFRREKLFMEGIVDFIENTANKNG